MSNYQFSPNQKLDLMNYARQAFDRRALLMEGSFPLLQSQVIEACSPAQVRKTLRELHTQGVESIRTTNHFFAEVRGILDYPVYLRFQTEAKSYYVYDAQINDYGAQALLRSQLEPPRGEPRKLSFDITSLDDASRARLTKWLTVAAREKRFATLAKDLVAAFVTLHCPSLYHLAARWPELKIIVGKLGEAWPNRVAELPSEYRLLSWGWSDNEDDPGEQWRARNHAALAMAGEVLVSAEMLPQHGRHWGTLHRGGVDSPADPVTAIVKGWRVKDKWTLI
jgi:hypothetical protein